MFGFLKPEVSGLKNVLNGYFTYKNQNGLAADLTTDQLKDFALWYYSVRLGPELAGAQSELKMRIAGERLEYLSRARGPTIMTILQGLLIAEGIDAQTTLFFNERALARVCDKFPPISPDVMGM